MAAAAIARFFEGGRVFASLPGNNESDRAIQSSQAARQVGRRRNLDHRLFMDAAGNRERLKQLAEGGARIFWIDHHRTAVSRADAPEFKVPFAGKVLSEKYSAARLTFDYLKHREDEFSQPRSGASSKAFRRFAEIADDHDRWIHQIPESPDWALAVQTLGGIPSYREIIKLREPKMSRRLRDALLAGQDAMRRSIEFAKSTLVLRPLSNGVTLRTACCFGYSSEVAAHLYENATRPSSHCSTCAARASACGAVADCEVDLSKLAEQFGGGGHAAASGFMIPELRRVPAERLAEMLAERVDRNDAQLLMKLATAR